MYIISILIEVRLQIHCLCKRAAARIGVTCKLVEMACEHHTTDEVIRMVDDSDPEEDPSDTESEESEIEEDPEFPLPHPSSDFETDESMNESLPHSDHDQSPLNSPTECSRSASPRPSQELDPTIRGQDRHKHNYVNKLCMMHTNMYKCIRQQVFLLEHTFMD